MDQNNKKNMVIAWIIIAISVMIGLGIRIVLFPYVSSDFVIFLDKWYSFIKENGGIFALKHEISNYSAMYMYLLALLTYIPIKPLVGIKVISVIFDVVCAGFIYRIVRIRYEDPITPAAAFAVAFLAPTIIINSSMWGQCDSIYSSAILISVYYLLKEKKIASFCWLGVAFSLKLQAIFIFPLFLILLFKKQVKLYYIMLIPIVYFLSIIPCVVVGRSFIKSLMVYVGQVEYYKVLCLNAPNLYMAAPNRLYYVFYPLGLGITVTAISILCIWVVKRTQWINNDLIIKITMFLVILLPYILPKMHERYFYLADLFSIVYVFYYRKYWYIPLSMWFASLVSYCPFFLFVADDATKTDQRIYNPVMLGYKIAIPLVLFLIIKIRVDLANYIKKQSQSNLDTEKQHCIFEK